MKKSYLYSGILSIVIFTLSIVVFGLLHEDFHFLNSYISELGAQGAPNALVFNLLAFVLPGLLLIHFGWYYGKKLQDKALGFLLGLYGLAFVFTAIPVDSLNQDTPYSRAHVTAICLALAAWLFGLAKLAAKNNIKASIKKRANIAALLLVLFMATGSTDLWPMPITHRLVFSIVFGWTLLTSLDNKEPLAQKD